MAGGAAAELIGRSAGAAAWFKNTKGAGPAARWAACAGSAAGSSAGLQCRPLPPWGGGLVGSSRWCKTELQVGFRRPSEPRSWARRAGPARRRGSRLQCGCPAERSAWAEKAPAPLPGCRGFGGPRAACERGFRSQPGTQAPALRREGVGSPSLLLSVKCQLQQWKESCDPVSVELRF